MTAICGGGTSQAIASKGTALIVSASMITAGLALISPWLVPFAALLDGFTYDILSSCGTDPPAVPTFELSDLSALAFGIFSPNYQTALGKLRDLVLNWLWFQNCQCVTGSIPSFVPPVQPTGVQVPSPQIGTAACWTRLDALHLPQCYTQPVDAECQIDDRFYGWQQPGTTGPEQLVVPPTSYAIWARISVHNEGANPMPMQLRGVARSSTGLIISWASGGDILFAAPGTSVESTWVFGNSHVPQTANVWPSYIGNSSIRGTNTCDIEMSLYCQPTSTPTAPCCPPDPAMLTALQQINSTVQLLQRQLAPFAYVAGTTHAGLSGSGALNVAGLLGVKVVPSALPASTGREIGDPDSLWLDSWLRWGNADGWAQREFLTSAPFVSLPSLASQFTKVGYTLARGLTVDITELVREP